MSITNHYEKIKDYKSQLKQKTISEFMHQLGQIEIATDTFYFRSDGATYMLGKCKAGAMQRK